MAPDSFTALHPATLPSTYVLKSEKCLTIGSLEALHPVTLPPVAKMSKNYFAVCCVALSHPTTIAYQLLLHLVIMALDSLTAIHPATLASLCILKSEII